MYSLARVINSPITRRGASYRQAAFEDFFRPFADMVNSPLRTNVKETDTAYLFEAEMPGFEQSEIELSILDGLMTIQAEHKEAENEGETRVTRSMRRNFTIENVDEEGITAQYKNGILSINLPKAAAPEAPEPRRISIE